METDAIIQKLREFEDKTPDDWREKVEFMHNNHYWLKYSNRIAMKMLLRMEELSLTNKEMAVQLGISEEYLAKILKGQENLTLETIAKIEIALGLQIMAFQDKH